MNEGNFKVYIDGRWELEDFGVFSKQYTQCYSLLYSLAAPSQETELARRGFQFEYSKYPWRGGFSVINFYYSLYARIPDKHRPEVKSIRYASPGAIELAAIVEVAVQLGAIVTAVALSFDRINATYSNIQKGIRQRRLGRIEVAVKEMQFSQSQVEYIDWAIGEISSAMQLSPEYLEVLHQRTGGNRLVQLKVLLSLYRRVEPIAELVKEDMVKFQSQPDENANDE